MREPRVAITMGDPAGIGPELCLRLFTPEAPTRLHDLTVFGSREVLDRVARATGLPGAGHVRDLGPVENLRPGVSSPLQARAAIDYLEAAVDATLDGEFDALVTCPIHKESLRASGIQYPGHTELLVAKTGAPHHCMMLTSPALTCSLVTAHLPLREVPRQLSTGRIVEVVSLTNRAMARFHGRTPRLAVLGLNPHAGEHGIFGEEEERFITPAIHLAREEGIDLDGPLPPDTAFIDSKRSNIDAYVCMYHDQGLIPLKTLAFDEGVNVTLGLPMVRTSVDHGTAFDIAWQGIARPASLYAAVNLAIRLVEGGR